MGGFPQAVAGWRQTGAPAASFTQALWDVIYGEAIARARLSRSGIDRRDAGWVVPAPILALLLGG